MKDMNNTNNLNNFSQTQDLTTLKKWRRDLHQIPELALTLPKTQSYLWNILSNLECTLSKPIEYGIAAFFDADKKTTLAFRTDMDALPVLEKTGRPFQSKHEGCMHACGHDGHMSAMLLFAQRLNEYYKSLDYNVLLIFQPGEETPGGAKPILESGLFEKYNVVNVFGTHLWPLIEKGVLATRKGPLMASATEVDIVIYGKAVHSARKEEGIDALAIGMEFLKQAYELESSLPNEVFRLLQFGKMEAGVVRNVVAGECILQGTLRAFEDEYVSFLKEGLETIAQKLAEKTGATIEVNYSAAYPAVINDPELVDTLVTLRPNMVLFEKPLMIAEDFAFYQRKVPGVFFYTGTGTGIELHDARFDFDEDILLKTVDLYEDIVHYPNFKKE